MPSLNRPSWLLLRLPWLARLLHRPIRITATGPADQLAALLSGLRTYLNLRGRPGMRVRIDLTITDREDTP
ncbi:hypothetical protein O7543_29775 [Solwaraspora sp. WMMA2080]|uniref:hypothetical protein n=1 Tax=unclassified Solwaraspora TaxID=2627926 RepID=UPI00248CFF86|nr:MULTISPECIES: hypothetical protein [unclassified Solwaraspora]WBB95215.1 hypothetical protein O7553_17575 [Solwaraspora sp. WMMA2059]WBC20879.1 hypothetical protein O7543_29775 [Solwaraspora sp. WMMA2080]